MWRVVLVVSFFSTMPLVAFSAPPDVKGLFPTGAAIGSTVDVTINGKLEQPGTQVWCDQPGLTLEVPEKDAVIKAKVAADAAPGLYHVRFFNAEGATSLFPFVVGTLPEVLDVEPNNALEKAQKLESSSVINGKLAEAGDVDTFAVSLKAGQTVVASVNANWKLGSPLDALLQVLGPDGAIVEQNDDDHGNDPLVSVTATRDGTWYVRIFGFPAAPDSSIRFIGGATYHYRLTVTTGPFANHAVPSVLTAERKLKMVGWNIGDDIATLSIDKLTQAAFGRTPYANTIAVDPIETSVVVEAEPNDLQHPQALTVGSVACGAINIPGDEDIFSFRATKGQKLEFDVESRSLGLPLDAAIRIRSSDKKVLVDSDDAPGKDFDPFVKFVAPADGDYTVSIRDIFRNGGWRFAYRLYLRETQPAVSLKVAADIFNVMAEKPTEIPVTLARTDGFADEVSVSVVGLPPGVTCDAVVSPVKGENSASLKLNLKAAENAEPFSGVIQITGQPTKPDSKSVTAKFSLPNSTMTTDRLWLTVLKKKEPAK